MAVTEKDIRTALKGVKDPELGLDLVVLGPIYDIEIAYQDEQIGRVLDALEQTQELANTIVAENGDGDVQGALDPGSANNLVGDGSGMTGISDGSQGNRVGTAQALIDPRLAPLGDVYQAGTLSGGQLKLLELARVLMADPKIILLDELAAGVNPSLMVTLVEKIQALNERGHTFLIIEHNMDVVMSICEPILVMAQGRLIYQGDAAGARADPAVLDAYLGDLP